MEEMVKNLKSEILGKEFTLLELDNYLETATGSQTSLFDCNDCIEQESCAYITDYNDVIGEVGIVVNWETIKQEEDKLCTVVKVSDICEL